MPDSGTVVAHRDGDPIILLDDLDRHARPGAAFHRIKGVRDQVDEHLLKARRIRQYSYRAIRQRQHDLEVGLANALVEQKERVVDRLLDRERSHIDRILAGERLQLPRDLSHTVGQIANSLEVFTRVVQPAAVEKGTGIGREHAEGREWLIELVGNPRRHLTENGKLAGLDQTFFGAPSLADFLLQAGI